MTQATTDNFWAALTAWNPPAPAPVFYRLYYNDQGRPLFYTMEDLPGNYIEVDLETYLISPTNARVVDGHLVLIETRQFNKLRPGQDGTCCDPTNVAIVVEPSEPHIKWSLNNHAQD
jgi:hypothetical protein